MGSSAGHARLQAAGPALAALLVLLSCNEGKVADASTRLSASPAALDFGAVFVGDRVSLVVEVRSDGRVPVTLGLLDAPEGVELDPPSAELPSGGRLQVRVVFAPPAAGEIAGPVVLGDGRARVEVPLTGLGVERRLEAPAELDFGPVVIGEPVVEAVRLVNRSVLPVSLEPRVEGADADAFRVAGPVELAADAAVELPVRFSPTLRGPASAVLRLSPCSGCDPLEVELRGTGQLDRVTAVPAALDFGMVLTGSSRELGVVLRNEGDVPRTIAAFRLSPALEDFAADDRSLPRTIRPGEEAAFTITFAPFADGFRTTTLAALDEEGEPIVGVALSGQGQELEVVVDPGVVDFGNLAVGSSTTLPVGVSVAGGTLRVASAALEGAASAYRFTVSRPLPTDVGAPVDLEVTYAPTRVGTHAAAIVLVTTDPRHPTIRIPLVGAAVLVRPCRLEAQPAALPFGLITAGTTVRKTVTVTAVGDGPCRLADLAIGGPPDGPFSVGEPAAEVVLERGESQTLEVTYAPPPDRYGEAGATLRIVTAAPTEIPELAVALSGEAFAGALQAIPDPVDFGRIVFGRPAFRAVELRNVGAAPLTIRSAAFGAGSASELTLRVAPPWPVTLGPGAGVTIAVALTPVANHRVEGVLEVGVDGATQPKLVEVRGEVVAGTCGPACHAPTAVCPGRIVTEVAREVRLNGLGLDPDGDALVCSWSVASAPVGSTAGPRSAGPCALDFTADLVGDYEFELTVTDPAGHTGTCLAPVHADPYSGLWIETFWDLPADVDLHLLHPTHHPGLDPFDAWSWGGTDGADCFYATCRPDLPPLSWPDAPGPEDDPSLDADSQHLGPENIRIDVPNRTHPYWIGVHWLYNPLGHPDLRVTTNVYCGRVLATSQTTTILHRQHVVLGRVDVNPDGTCAFTGSGVRLSY